MIIGVISDTHGLLRPEAVAALHGSELILHAGDIGKQEILEELESIAPVVAVRGNNDEDHAWAQNIPEKQSLEFGRKRLYMLHDRKQLANDPREEGYDVVVSGHSHKPLVERDNGVLYLNPGSAGPRRFKLPVSVAILEIEGSAIDARLIELKVPTKSRSRKESR